MVEFSVGASYTVPTQVVFVSMPLLLPTPLVPMLVALGFLGSAAIEVARGRRALARMPLAVADAWFSVAPPVLLVLLGVQEPGWSHWPVYVAALAAQLLGDLIVAMARFSLSLGARPRDTLAEYGLVGWVEALLAPVGLLAAMAGAPAPVAAAARAPARRPARDPRPRAGGAARAFARARPRHRARRPAAARIVSACDAFDAMTTDRSYRRALPLDVALRELADNAGTQFDPAVVDALLAVAGGADEPAWRRGLAGPAETPVARSAPQDERPHRGTGRCGDTWSTSPNLVSDDAGRG